MVDVHDSALTLYPLDHQELIDRLFSECDIKARTSQPGLIAKQIIHAMREFEPLRACAVFKIPGVRKLIKETRARETVPWTKALRLIGSDGFRRFKRLYIEPRDKKNLRLGDVLTFLIKKRIYRPVLGLWTRLTLRRSDFRCPTCGLSSRLRMSMFEGSWRCQYCRTEHYLPEYLGRQFRKKNAWRVKKTGLFAKDNNQEGAIPVILALMRFSHAFHLGGFFYSTALSLKGAVTCETDLCVVQYRNGGSIEIGIGECKADKGWITDDIAKLTAVRAKLKKIGVEPYLIFAKTAPSFAEHELARFRALYGRSVPFILLTNRELESVDYVTEDGDHSYRSPFTLSDMALNSARRYL